MVPVGTGPSCRQWKCFPPPHSTRVTNEAARESYVTICDNMMKMIVTKRGSKMMRQWWNHTDGAGLFFKICIVRYYRRSMIVYRKGIGSNIHCVRPRNSETVRSSEKLSLHYKVKGRYQGPLNVMGLHCCVNQTASLLGNTVWLKVVRLWPEWISERGTAQLRERIWKATKLGFASISDLPCIVYLIFYINVCSSHRMCIPMQELLPCVYHIRLSLIPVGRQYGKLSPAYFN